MTFADLRALHAILGDALDDIEHIYAPSKNDKASYASPPPSPSTPLGPLDFPSLNDPLDASHPAEQLTSHPVVLQAINKMVAAAGQIAMTVQRPFYSLCDAAMGYNLPACMRLLEASHTVEILREAGPNGLHVNLISQQNGVDSGRLAHILRLLATHHFISERSPDVFAINRISSMIDSRKSFEDIRQWEKEGRPEMKYQDSNGIAAFVGMCTDELFKSSAYLTEAYLLGHDQPSRTPFGYAFETDVPFFAWLEGEGGEGRTGLKVNKDKLRVERFGKAMSGSASWEAPGAVFEGFDWGSLPRGSVIVDVGGGIGSTSMLLANTFCRPNNGKANPTPFSPPLSSSDLPAQIAEDKEDDFGFKFIIQDRHVVVEMGEKAWRAKCPELLDSGIAQFQVHDFFTTQPIRNAAVFFLRVILHDWPDALARSILLHLREAATPDTKLVLAEFVLPLACVDADTPQDGAGDILADIEGADSTLASAPLLANLGKASANAYWMDLTMQVTFNAQERTLRETTALALSTGWKVVKVTRSPGSLFGHIVAIPVSIPIQRRARAGSGSALLDVPTTSKTRQSEASAPMSKQDINEIERASSRCGTPTFGSRTDLPSMQEAISRFGGRNVRPRPPGSALKVPCAVPAWPATLRQPAVITSSHNAPVKKKKPSPLSLSSPKPSSPSPLMSPTLSSPLQPMRRRQSLAQLRSPSQRGGPVSPVPPLPRDRLAPPSPTSPSFMSSLKPALPRRGSNNSSLLTHTPTHSITSVVSTSPLPPASPLPRPRTLTRPKSLAHLYQTAQAQSSSPVKQSRSPIPPLPPIRPSPPRSATYSPQTSLSEAPPARQGILRRASHAPPPQASILRKRSGSTIGPPIGGTGAGTGGAVGMSGLLRGTSVRGSGGGTINFEVTGTTEGEGLELKPASEPTVLVGKTNVNALAAAARIDRGALPRPTSP